MSQRPIGGHIRPRYTKDGIISSWQVVLYLGKTPEGKNINYYYKADSKEEAEVLLQKKQAEAILKAESFVAPLLNGKFLLPETLQSSQNKIFISKVKPLQCAVNYGTLFSCITSRMKYHIGVAQK